MNKEAILESNCSFLQQYNHTLADKLLHQDNEKVKAAVTIQRFYRAYVARKVYSRLLAEELNKEEEEFFQRELERASESTVWLQRSRLKRKLSEKETVDTNATRRREQSAICIQRHWRRWKSRSTFVPVNFDPTFVSILEENFPDICDQYSISTSGMVFSGSPRISHLSSNQIVRKIVPNNNNMSLFNEIDSEYTLELDSDKSEAGTVSALSEFETPIPAKRPLIQTSYVFEKELREDFDNPYYIDSSDEEEEEAEDEEETSRPQKLCSSQSLESRVSDGSLGQVCDSGFEDDTRGSSCSLPRPSVAAWQREEEETVINRDALSRPAAVQMCFVEEVPDDGEDLSEDLKNLRMRDVLPQNKRLTKSAQSSSESNIASSKLRTDNSTCKRPRSYGGGDQPDMKELKKGWANSAHLMTVQQLLNWRNVMQCNFANVNMELMEHLANRDELQEQQDQLLQKIFALKNINENGGIKPKSTQEKEPPNFKRRVSSLFGK